MSERRGGLPRTSYQDLARARVPEVEPLGGIFDRLVREFAPAIAPEVVGAGARLGEIEAIWRRAVGDEIAEHARPARFRGGVLTVEVDAAPLAAELGTFARAHLERALEREGLVGLCELRFRTGRPRSGRGGGTAAPAVSPAVAPEDAAAPVREERSRP